MLKLELSPDFLNLRTQLCTRRKHKSSVFLSVEVHLIIVYFTQWIPRKAEELLRLRPAGWTLHWGCFSRCWQAGTGAGVWGVQQQQHRCHCKQSHKHQCGVQGQKLKTKRLHHKLSELQRRSISMTDSDLNSSEYYWFTTRLILTTENNDSGLKQDLEEGSC